MRSPMRCDRVRHIRAARHRHALWPPAPRRTARAGAPPADGAGRSSTAQPTILLGDVNEWFPWGRTAALAARVYFERTPHVSTFPSRCPVLALDRTRTSTRRAHLVAVSSPSQSAGPAGASDHLRR
ncbi:hypothetical protein ACTMU2_34990 [Cupriavidus basilensis]